MANTQAKLLASLAKKIKAERKGRNEIVDTLNSAGIITKNENFTVHFSNLGKVVTTSK